MSRIVHQLIAKAAKSIASEVYEVCCSNDRFYRAYPNRNSFVGQNWQEFIGHARESLLVMLRHVPGTEDRVDGDGKPLGPEYYYSQHIRDEVFEALTIDGANKTPVPVSLDRLRANAGFDPLDHVKGHRQALDA